MSVFLLIVFSLLLMGLAVLAYGALTDGLRNVYLGGAALCFIFVVILGLRLAIQSDAPPVASSSGQQYGQGSPRTPPVPPPPYVPPQPSPYVPLPPTYPPGHVFTDWNEFLADCQAHHGTATNGGGRDWHCHADARIDFAPGQFQERGRIP
jgi:hypothetical protein